MSVEKEELIIEAEAALILGVTPQRLQAIAAQGLLQAVSLEMPGGMEIMHFRGEVLRLKEHLNAGDSATDTEEWPDLIGE